MNFAIEGNSAEIKEKSQTEEAGVSSDYLKNFWQEGFEMAKEHLKREPCC